AHGGVASPPRVLIASTGYDQNAHYSPDGTKIVFQSTRSGSVEIWVCAADGPHCAPAPEAVPGPIAGTPRFSPDSKWIAYDSSWEGRFHVYITGAAGGKSLRLTPKSAGGAIPSWSHDGKWVYYTSAKDGESQIWKVSAAWGTPIQVTRGGGMTAFEDDSGKTLFYTRSEVDPTLWQCELDGSG